MQKGATPVIIAENSFTEKKKINNLAPARFSAVTGELERSARFTSLYIC